MTGLTLFEEPEPDSEPDPSPVLPVNESVSTVLFPEVEKPDSVSP